MAKQETYEEPIKDNNFRKDLKDLINSYNLEHQSTTPDLILAEYMDNCLNVFNKAMYSRSEWFSN